MSYKVEQLPGEPIIQATLYPDYRVSAELPLSNQVILGLLDAATQPLFLILDVQTSLDLGQIVLGAEEVTRGATPLLHHKNVRQVVVVTTNKIIALASKGLSSPLFGKINVVVFPTLDEALGYIRAQP
ncbi:MAG: hypothetical protein HY866_21280 [Chloroflexi bacterium]|nr:hypothetical protein [Chloroflexota bacterium]